MAGCRACTRCTSRDRWRCCGQTSGSWRATAQCGLPTLLDVGPDSVVVVFDYRRYDDEVVEFGRGAGAAGAAVVLMTDTYLSPLTSAATVLLTSSVEGPAPFITLTPALAIVEALVLGAVRRTGRQVRRRLERFDALSADLSSAT